MPPICPTTTPASNVPTTLPSEKRAESQPADLEADRQGQEDGELGMLPQRGEQQVDHRMTRKNHGVPITR